MYSIIVACDTNNGIGYNNSLPWDGCPADMKEFRKRTIGNGNNAVIMGHNTYWSIPEQYRPLKFRKNIVVSRDTNFPKDVIVFKTLKEAMVSALLQNFTEIYVIGGEKIYAECMKSPLIHYIDNIYLTRFHTSLQVNKFFPSIFEILFEPRSVMSCEADYVKDQKKYPIQLSFEVWRRKPNPEEQRYLTLLKEIIMSNNLVPSRTGTGCYSIFGRDLRISLRNNVIPLLTTKQVFFRGVVAELLFFISGSTDTNKLRQQNIHIWDGNTTREFLDSHGLSHYPEYDMGPTYSFLFTHAGAEHAYQDKNTDYTGQGVNQIHSVIDGIKRDPNSRRHLIVLWSPAHLDKMSLPPCLFSYIFHVNTNTREISVMTTMRSADFFLGVPFNLASAALFLHIICAATGYYPGELYATFGDAHVYGDHLNAVEEQLTRTPWTWPTLKWKRSFNDIGAIENIVYEDFLLENYICYPKINAPMAV